MRRMAVVVAVLVGVLATSCYQDLDFDADHKADFVYVDAAGRWKDAAAGTTIFEGQPGDIPVPGDYDGDHLFDVAVVRSSGDWVTESTRGTFSFPAPPQLAAFVTPYGSDYFVLPVPGDYDGDGSDEAAWYRDTDATWFIEGSAPIVFGNGPSLLPATPGAIADQDYPVPADYDGDGTTDLATFSPRTHEWKVLESSTGSLRSQIMPGNAVLALPLAYDYDGVGHAQRATAGGEGLFIEGHGAAIELTPGSASYPAFADYDGDGRADLSVVTEDDDWATPGQPTYHVVDFGQPYASFPVATGHNLIWNIARFTAVGMCVTNPGAFC